MSNITVNVTGLHKSFSQGKETIDVLKGVDFQAMEGEIVSIMAESGRGKSTLLQVIGGILSYNSGMVEVLGHDIAKLSDNKKTQMRLMSMGFVYQYHHLLSDFSALENVMVPQLLAGKEKRTAKKHATELLSRLGLADRVTHRPAELSGGQQQRVAIARALANDPKIIIADEPSGNLDFENTGLVMDIFLQLAREKQTTLVIATHSAEISRKTDRVFRL